MARIYIARGDDTLGPYLPAEAAALVKGGFLLPHELAARSGDPEWVALSKLLPVRSPIMVEAVPAVAVAAPAVGEERRWLRLWPVVLISAALGWLGGSVERTFHRSPPTPTTGNVVVNTKPKLPPPTAPPKPSAAPAVPVVRQPSPPPPAEEKGGQLTGTISVANIGPVNASEAMQVRAFPLKLIGPYLSDKKAEAKAELDRLAPQIAASEAERNARIATEQDALHELYRAAPTDPMRASLEFAHEQAKAAVKNADDDRRYFRDLRHDAEGAEAYFHDLPAPVATANVDATGAFTFDLPPGGPFAVAACVRQTTADGSRLRYWLVKASLADEGPHTVTLSDANATSAHDPDSLIQTPE